MPTWFPTNTASVPDNCDSFVVVCDLITQAVRGANWKHERPHTRVGCLCQHLQQTNDKSFDDAASPTTKPPNDNNNKSWCSPPSVMCEPTSLGREARPTLKWVILLGVLSHETCCKCLQQTLVPKVGVVCHEAFVPKVGVVCPFACCLLLIAYRLLPLAYCPCLLPSA